MTQRGSGGTIVDRSGCLAQPQDIPQAPNGNGVFGAGALPSSTFFVEPEELGALGTAGSKQPVSETTHQATGDSATTGPRQRETAPE